MSSERQTKNSQQDEEVPAFTLPAEVTPPCQIFVLENGRMVGLINEFAGMAFRIENLIQVLSNDDFFIRAVSDGYRKFLAESSDVTEEDENFDIAGFLSDFAERFPKAEQVIRPYVPMLNQMFLSRAVDSFLLYLTEMLLLMYKTKLGALPAAETGIEEFIGLMTEQYVERTSMGGTQKLITDFKTTFNFRLFPSQGVVTSSEVDRVIARRNVIVHNRGIANRYYLRNVPTQGLRIGDPIPFVWEDVRADVLVLLRAVLDIDGRLSAQFNLPRMALTPTGAT